MHTDNYHATKYASPADEFLDMLARNEWGDDEFGDVESPIGYITGLVITPGLALSDLAEAMQAIYGADTFARQWRIELGDIIGWFILTTDVQGFVSVRRFPDAANWQAEMNYLCAEFNRWEEDRD